MCKLLIIIICVHLFATIALAEDHHFRCDYKYVQSLDGWLKLHQIPANWHEARLRCSLEGAVLASPTDAAFNSAMVSMMKTGSPTHRVFTGIHATFSRGDFFSIEGVPLWRISPRSWAQSEPDNKGDDESCLVMNSDGTFADEKCSDTFSYMCYKKRTSEMLINKCGTTDPDYVFYDSTNSCYKVHVERLTWSRAYMTCSAEGGYLAIINSEKEAEIIRQILTKHEPDTIHGYFRKDIAFVGFHDWGEHGTWLTVHGETLKEAGYANWSKGEPNNASRGQFCGCVFRDALLCDVECEYSILSICEKDPDSLQCPSSTSNNIGTLLYT